jgi:hypothetical protein
MEISKIITAEEFLEEITPDVFRSDTRKESYIPSTIHERMIEFARLHVQAALKAAAENAAAYVSVDDEPTVSKGSIFSAYRLSNIK